MVELGAHHVQAALTRTVISACSKSLQRPLTLCLMQACSACHSQDFISAMTSGSLLTLTSDRHHDNTTVYE